ncbi:MAG: ribonuclease R [Tenericutes bacterium]|nr:ribonuclease R [Mycoplasmatota bacterium]
MEDRILELLNRKNKALSIQEIDHLLELKTTNEFRELEDTINKMCNEYTIYCTNKGNYMTFDRSPLKKGILRVNRKGFGFVELPDEEDIYIDAKNMNGALHNDLVVAEVTGRKEKNKLEGRILKILDRKLEYVIGEFYLENGVGHLILDEENLKMNVIIEKDDIHGAVDGHKVQVRLLEQKSDHTYRGEVTKILGHKNDPGVDILSIVYKYNISDTFPEEVIEQLKTIPSEVSDEDKVGRTDLTDITIFTIDGDDTKDIDDAVSIKKLQNGNYELGVHIADVSYYIKEGTPLDVNAMDRGTSVYLVDRVIPMIPHQLSNGICSLNEGVERLTISCVMEINLDGKIVDYNIFPSYIRSRKKMTYKNVNSILEKNIVPEGYEEFADDLRLMAELAKILRKSKIKRGYLDFDVDEAKILVDEKCHPTDIVLRERGVGENLIEDFMIIANECVATHIFYMELPFIYRVHEVPKEEKIHDFLSYIGTLGYVYKGNMKDNNPKAVQGLLEFLKDKKEFKILSSLLLRSMQKAVYKPQNLGHYCLASKCYTHFTSPIRRYPDTTVHRLLRTYLFNNDLSPETISHWENKLPVVAEIASSRERASINCEREVDDMKMAEYMEDHIGEEFKGMISGITNFGIFIQLDNLVEGLCRLADMKEFYHYDEKAMCVVGEKTKTKYSLGDEVVVKVVRASKEEQTIDFEILRKDLKQNEDDTVTKG